MTADRGGVLRPGWIVGPRADALMFSGSVAAGLAIVLVFALTGRLDAGVPPWLFLLLVVGVDVSHVYATAFRAYLDPARFRQRPALFVGVPLLCFAGGLVAWSAGSLVFWRLLAYLAVYHFVRQQWGWVAYARRRAGEGRVDLRLDQLATYGATLYPLLVWHASGPREIAWFLEGDFLMLPASAAHLVLPAATALHWAVNVAFLARQFTHARSGRGVNWAKVQIVATTWVAWYGGIVWLDSDVAFTALNVLSHGVPYLVVLWHVEAVGARAGEDEERSPFARVFRPGLRFAVVFLGFLAVLGYSEEWLWHQLVWRDQLAVFPGPLEAVGAAALSVLVPLLAVPQATHYVLDGWLWRVAANPDVGRFLGPESVALVEDQPDGRG